MNNQSSQSDETRSLLEATANATEEKVIDARNRLAAAMDAAKETYGRIQDKAVEGAKATDRAIRENPYQAIGIAFGLGALIGFFLSRRGRE